MSIPCDVARVVVVHFGSLEVTRRTISGLVALPSTFSITVVSNDQTPDPAWERVTWLVSPRNDGYFGGVRFFLDKQGVDGHPLVILNNDLSPTVNGVSLGSVVETLVTSLLAHPQIGIIGPRLVDISCEKQTDLEPCSFPRFTKVRSPIRVKNELPGGVDGAEVDWLAGSVLVVAGDLVHEVIDDSYGLGGEDTDLGFRTWMRGRTVVRLNQEVGHFTSSTIGRRNWTYLGPRGTNRFLRRHHQYRALLFAVGRDIAVAGRHCIRASRLRDQKRGREPGQERSQEFALARIRLRGTIDGALNNPIRESCLQQG